MTATPMQAEEFVPLLTPSAIGSVAMFWIIQRISNS